MKYFVILVCHLFILCSTSINIKSPIFHKSQTSNDIQKFLQDEKEIGIFLDILEINKKEFKKTLLEKSYYNITFINTRKDISKKLKKDNISILLIIQFKEKIVQCNDKNNFLNIIYNIKFIFKDIKDKRKFTTQISPIYQLEKGLKKCKSTLNHIQYEAEKYVINEIKKYIFPSFMKRKVKFFLKYKKDSNIEDSLKLSYQKFKKSKFQESFDILKSLEKKNIWQVYANLGNHHYLFGNYQKAIFYYNKAVKNQNLAEKDKKYLSQLIHEILKTAQQKKDI